MDIVVPQKAVILTGRAAQTEQRKAGSIAVNEIYLDGKLKKAEDIDEQEKSFGIFMHSLVLSNYAEVMKVNSNHASVIGDEYEKAIFRYASQKGFNKNLIETIAPKVSEFTVESEQDLRMSAHLINEKVRIVSKGTPEELLRRCSYILLDSTFVKITRKILRDVNDVLRDMLNRCLNVYAIAIKDSSGINKSAGGDKQVGDMTLVALVGMGKS